MVREAGRLWWKLGLEAMVMSPVDFVSILNGSSGSEHNLWRMFPCITLQSGTLASMWNVLPFQTWTMMLVVTMLAIHRNRACVKQMLKYATHTQATSPLLHVAPSRTGHLKLHRI
jgi:hypothetical protein